MRKLCENCTHSRDHEHVEHKRGSYIRVRCAAPVPAIADMAVDDDDRLTGHLAAKRCECFSPRDDA